MDQEALQWDGNEIRSRLVELKSLLSEDKQLEWQTSDSRASQYYPLDSKGFKMVVGYRIGR